MDTEHSSMLQRDESEEVEAVYFPRGERRPDELPQGRYIDRTLEADITCAESSGQPPAKYQKQSADEKAATAEVTPRKFWTPSEWATKQLEFCHVVFCVKQTDRSLICPPDWVDDQLLDYLLLNMEISPKDVKQDTVTGTGYPNRVARLHANYELRKHLPPGRNAYSALSSIIQRKRKKGDEDGDGDEEEDETESELEFEMSDEEPTQTASRSGRKKERYRNDLTPHDVFPDNYPEDYVLERHQTKSGTTSPTLSQEAKDETYVDNHMRQFLHESLNAKLGEQWPANDKYVTLEQNQYPFAIFGRNVYTKPDFFVTRRPNEPCLVVENKQLHHSYSVPNLHGQLVAEAIGIATNRYAYLHEQGHRIVDPMEITLISCVHFTAKLYKVYIPESYLEWSSRARSLSSRPPAPGYLKVVRESQLYDLKSMIGSSAMLNRILHIFPHPQPQPQPQQTAS